jgi:diguanylate cyclase (GGDEF)-like protein/PAS domain S-box-containing protein
MLWNMSLDMMATASLDGYLTRLNPAWEETLGYTPDELMSRPYLDFVHPDDVAGTVAETSALADNAFTCVRFENRHRAKDGTYHWLSWSTRTAHDRSTIYCIVRDVTPFRDAEAEREALRNRLREREQLLNGVLENTLSLIYVKDLEGRYLFYNQRFADAFQLEERGRAVGQSGREVLLARDDTWLDPKLEPLGRENDIRAATEAVSIEEWSEHPTRGRLTYDSIKFPLYDEAGRAYATCGVSLETTDRVQAAEQVREAEERFRSAFQNAPIGMALTSLDGRILRANRALCEITGYSDTELLQRSLQDITHPDDVDSNREQVVALRAGELSTHRGEKRLSTASGDIVWVESSRSLVRDAHGQPQHVILQVRDISERKRLEERLQYLADVDSLTGIRNRRLFEEDLHTQVGRCQRYGEQAAMLMVDLDDFKKVNDTYGHKVGDDMLKAVATALRRRLRTGDRAGRLGGDEFGVLLSNVSRTQADALAVDFGRAVEEATVTVGNEVLAARASVGVAFIDEHSVGDEAVLAEADRSMYAAKRAGRAKGRRQSAKGQRRDERSADVPDRGV